MIDKYMMIGGADGPTSVFIAGELGNTSWLNIFGLIIVALILIPNIIYAIAVKGQKNKCKNMFMNILEQVGRYACMLLMIFNVGIAEFGFSNVALFLAYLFGNAVLLVAYWVVWILYFKKPSFGKQIALAVIPTAIFLLCGVTMGHWLLVVFAVVFGVAHVYVTCKNKV
jgi:hypothetical protein